MCAITNLIWIKFPKIIGVNIREIIYYNSSDWSKYTFNKGFENVGNYYTDFAIFLNNLNKFMQQEKFLKKLKKKKIFT